MCLHYTCNICSFQDTFDYKYSSVLNMKPAAVVFEEKTLGAFSSDESKQHTLCR